MKDEDKKFWQFLRSGLRRLSQRYPPLYATLNAAKRPYDGPNKRQKVCYECAKCKGLFSKKEVAVDHIVPCGSLNCKEDVANFIETLFCDSDNLQVLCSECHGLKRFVDEGYSWEEAEVMKALAAFKKAKAVDQIKALTELAKCDNVASNAEGRVEQYRQFLLREKENEND